MESLKSKVKCHIGRLPQQTFIVDRILSIMRYRLLSILILFLVASCQREDEPERVYDLAQSRALMTTGEQLLDGIEDATAVPAEAMAQLEATPDGRRVADALHEQWAQRELVTEANQLLATERYNDLAELLERAQREGLATTQLLELNGLPQALQALRLYCARRPYEHASDLEQNLEFLRPWLRQLQAFSPAFQNFYQEQQAQLLAMRQQEAVAVEENILQRLDWMLSTTALSSQAGDYLAQAANDFPQLPILRYLSRSGTAWQPTVLLDQQLSSPSGFLARASTRERLSLELAIALTWEALDNDAHQRIAEEWKNFPATTLLTGTFLRAKCLKSPELFENGFDSWQRRATETECLRDSPAFLGDYLDSLFSTEVPSSAWDIAAPDFASVLSRFLEAAK